MVTGLGYTLALTTDVGALSWQTRDTLRDWARSAAFRPDGGGSVILYDFHTKENTLVLVSDFGKTWTVTGPPETHPDWPQHRIGLWYDKTLFIDELHAFRIRTDPQDIGPHDNLVYVDESKDGGQSWQEAIFTTQGEYLNQLRAPGNSLWIQTWDNLYRLSGLTIIEDPDFPVLRLSPNPADASALCRFSTADRWSGPATLRIFTMDGKLQLESGVTQTLGVTEFYLPQLPPASYRVSLEREGKITGAATLLLR